MLTRASKLKKLSITNTCYLDILKTVCGPVFKSQGTTLFEDFEDDESLEATEAYTDFLQELDTSSTPRATYNVEDHATSGGATVELWAFGAAIFVIIAGALVLVAMIRKRFQQQQSAEYSVL